VATETSQCADHAQDAASVGGLRGAIFFAESNGFDVCVVRFGRKLLLDEARVFAWMRERGTLSAPASGGAA
jgi:hypothetical protein